MENVMKSKRFVVRKSLIGKNQVITFTNKKGDNITYNHDKVYSIMKNTLVNSITWFFPTKDFLTTNLFDFKTFSDIILLFFDY